jgi:hypothetical protein
VKKVAGKLIANHSHLNEIFEGQKHETPAIWRAFRGGSHHRP